jgi:hypothetical protein
LPLSENSDGSNENLIFVVPVLLTAVCKFVTYSAPIESRMPVRTTSIPHYEIEVLEKLLKYGRDETPIGN